MLQLVIDSDTIIETLLNRANSPDGLDEIWDVLRFQHIQGYITEIGLERIFVYLTKLKDADVAEEVVSILKEMVTILYVDRDVMDKARSLSIQDFESAVEVVCAREFDCWALVTHSESSFLDLDLQILTIDDVLSRHRFEERLGQARMPSLLVGDLLQIRKLEKLYEKESVPRKNIIFKGKEQLAGTSLQYSDMSGNNLCYADLTKTDMSFSDLINAQMVDAILHRTKLIDSNLERANLSKAEITYANLSGSNLANSNLSETRFDYSSLDRAVVSHADLSKASLISVSLVGASMTNTNARSTYLRNALLINADIRNSVFTGSDLVGANLSGAVARYSNLARANLFRAKLCSADFWKADLSFCNLTEADLRGANLAGAKLSGATVRGAIFKEARGLSDSLKDYLSKHGAILDAYTSATSSVVEPSMQS